MKGSLIVSLIATPIVVAFVPSTQGRWSRQRYFAATDGDGDEMSWQEGLERVLNPFVALGEKQIMLQNLVARREEVLADVQSAAANGSPQDLLPRGSELRRAVDGAQAVQRQLIEDILPSIVEEAPSFGPNVVSATPEIFARAAETVQLATDPEALSSAAQRLVPNVSELPKVLADEALNVVSSTPQGLQSPDFKVLDTISPSDSLSSPIEIRQYGSYAVASTFMGGKREESRTGLYTGGTFTSDEDAGVEDGSSGGNSDDGVAGEEGFSELDTEGSGASETIGSSELGAQGTEPPAADDSWWATGGLPGGFDGSDDTTVTEPSSASSARKEAEERLKVGGSTDEGALFVSSSESFNSLAAYIFGDNDEQTAIAMTTPVAIDYVGKKARRMSFALPPDTCTSAAAAPRPTSARVFVSEKVPALVAVREFGGFATEGEVRRQVLALKSDIAMRGVTSVPVVPALDPTTGEDLYSVLQYNPPTTLPFLRRNEIALLLQSPTEPEMESDQTTLTGSSSSSSFSPNPDVGGLYSPPPSTGFEGDIGAVSIPEISADDYDDGYPSD